MTRTASWYFSLSDIQNGLDFPDKDWKAQICSGITGCNFWPDVQLKILDLPSGPKLKTS